MRLYRFHLRGSRGSRSRWLRPLAGILTTATAGIGVAAIAPAAQAAETPASFSMVAEFEHGDVEEPERVAATPNGNVWVLDFGYSRVEEFSAAGKYEQAGGFGSTVYEPYENSSCSAQMCMPTGIATSSEGSAGRIWVAEPFLQRVREFNEAGQVLLTIKSAGSGAGQFDYPWGVAVGESDVFIADAGNGRIDEFTKQGAYVGDLGSQGSGAGQFTWPEDVAVQGGTMWVTDTGNNRLQKCTFTGEKIQTGECKAYGSQGKGSGGFESPESVAIEANGHVLVADSANNRIQEFGKAGEYLGQFGAAGSGWEQMRWPSGVAIDPQGNVLVLDSGNRRVEEWTAVSKPSIVVAPAISGTPGEGLTLHVGTGVWRGTAPITYSYQWQHCTSATACTNIAGATSSTYELGPGDVGDTVRVTVTASNSVGQVSATSAPTGYVSYPPYTFDDEFNGASVDTARWLEASGSNPSNGELECYTPANDAESGGYLTETLEVQPQPWTCPDGSGDNTYTSGAIEMRTFNFLYGTVAVRMKTSGGTGSYPTLWMMGYQCQTAPFFATSYCDWPHPGAEEVDIAEFKNSNFTTVNENDIYNTGVNNGSSSCTPVIANASTTYHLYELSWTPTALVYKVDGTTECTQTSNVPQEPMFLIIDTAVGGNNGGTVNNSTLPQTTSVDYAHVTTSGPAPNGLPVITGTPSSGDTLSASAGSWTGSPTSFSYQWQDCTAEGLSGTCTNITGATGSSYLLKSSDVGHTVDVNIVAHTATGAAGQVSAQTEPVK